MSMDAENKKSAGHLVINETTGAGTANFQSPILPRHDSLVSRKDPFSFALG